MTEIENARWANANKTTINAVFDGVAVSITDDPNNSERQCLADWVAAGNVIAEPTVALPSPADVKSECRRRILLVMTEDQQRNTLAAGQAAVMTFGADPGDWPPELQARQEAAMAAWTEIERLRSRSNAIEIMEPIPTDVTHDDLWSLDNEPS